MIRMTRTGANGDRLLSVPAKIAMVVIIGAAAGLFLQHRELVGMRQMTKDLHQQILRAGESGSAPGNQVSPDAPTTQAISANGNDVPAPDTAEFPGPGFYRILIWRGRAHTAMSLHSGGCQEFLDSSAWDRAMFGISHVADPGWFELWTTDGIRHATMGECEASGPTPGNE